MLLDDLNDENFLIFAIKSYNVKHYAMSEFEEDMCRIKYLKRLFRQYRKKKNLKERLIINHIICLSNVFGVESTVKILFFKIDSVDYIALKTFLLYLNFMPDKIHGIRGKTIVSSDLPVDLSIANVLRKI